VCVCVCVHMVPAYCYRKTAKLMVTNNYLSNSTAAPRWSFRQK